MEDNYFTMLYWFWFFSVQSSLWANSQEHDYWKNHSFGYADLCQWRDVLLFNMLSRFVIDILPRSKHLLISGLWSPSTMIWKPKKIKSATVFTFSMSLCHDVIRVDAMILVYLIFNFKLALSLSPLTLIKRLISSSLLSAIKVISPVYLRFFIFFPAILILACDSSSQEWGTLHRS